MSEKKKTTTATKLAGLWSPKTKSKESSPTTNKKEKEKEKELEEDWTEIKKSAGHKGEKESPKDAQKGSHHKDNHNKEEDGGNHVDRTRGLSLSNILSMEKEEGVGARVGEPPSASSGGEFDEYQTVSTYLCSYC